MASKASYACRDWREDEIVADNPVLGHCVAQSARCKAEGSCEREKIQHIGAGEVFPVPLVAADSAFVLAFTRPLGGLGRQIMPQWNEEQVDLVTEQFNPSDGEII
jgi:hypothetical protein